MESFETAGALTARSAWNNLRPRLTRPQRIASENAEILETLYFDGTQTNLKPNDLLLLVLGEGPDQQVLRRIATVTADFTAGRTEVTLQVMPSVAVVVQALRFLAAVLRILERSLEIGIPSRDATDALRQTLAQLVGQIKELSGVQGAARDSFRRRSVTLAITQIGILAGIVPGLWILAEGAVKEGDFRSAGWLDGLGTALKAELLRLSNPLRARALRGNRGLGRELEAIAALPDTPPLTPLESVISLVLPVARPPTVQFAGSQRLPRTLSQSLSGGSDVAIQALTALLPRLSGSDLYSAWANAPVTPPAAAQVYALRVTASLFGSSTLKRVLEIDPDSGLVVRTGEWPIIEGNPRGVVVARHEKNSVVYLDGVYDKIVPESWIIVDSSAAATSRFLSTAAPPVVSPLICRVASVDEPVARADYGTSGKTTRIELGAALEPSTPATWGRFDDAPLVEGTLEQPVQADQDFPLIRSTIVSAQSELLALAEEPIEVPVCEDRIELGALYDGLQSGRWIIFSGERADVYDANGVPVRGVQASELAMIGSVEQGADPTLPGEKVHTTLVLAKPLAYCYQRDTLTIYGNVVPATHGETRSETLGSGTSAAMQQFALKQPPLTYVSAPTPLGIASTLDVRVNDVRWHEADALAGLGPTDRRFVTKTDDAAITTVVFGDGEQGARPPTGIENIKAVYRSGIGKPGNVKAGQISLLGTRPAGAKDVVNPLRASGGADAESRDQARWNAPLAVTALDRLISTQDYADFARTFAGIGKAAAVRVSDGRRQVVRLTIAGEDDIPIDLNSDLFHNLRQALHDFGDPSQPFEVALRDLLALVLAARVRLLPDYLWEAVEVKLRAALLDAIGFARRALGQSLFLSEILSVMQGVAGVDYVEVDVLDGLAEGDVGDPNTLQQRLKDLVGARAPSPVVRASPTQLAFFVPTLPDALLLSVIDPEPSR
jgi:hypothetical protein